MSAKESGAPRQLRHSQSFAGVSLQGCPVRTGDAVSTQLRQQKKALLVAVSASVDKIVAHFSTARNLVQKAQLGDSQLTPEVGYLILNTLCPALHALVGDGLKAFQKDVITGHRPSSPWSVIEASARPGPHTRSFTALYWRVSRLAPLRSNHQRFHAFILGLLNLKQVEEWFAQLQRNSELISSLYLPTAFLLLSQRFCHRWAEELLLLLQPLSVLTFQLDLLFEHRHLPVTVRPMAQRSTPSPELGAGCWEDPGLTPPDLSEPPVSFDTLEDGFLAPSSPFQEWLLPQRLLGWRDRLASTLRGNGTPAWAQPGQEEMPAQPSGKWTPQWAKLWVAIKERQAANAEEHPKVGKKDPEIEKQASVCKEEISSAGIHPKPAMDTPEAGEVYLEAAQAGEEKSEVGIGNERWLGWLFGANSPGALNETDSSLSRSSRRPSRWLCPNVNTLALARKGGPTQKSWQEADGELNPPDPLQTYKAVRALCDHAGDATGHLAFCKGDILQVMETVDEDWLKCLSGKRQGLVPVGYTSLIV